MYGIHMMSMIHDKLVDCQTKSRHHDYESQVHVRIENFVKDTCTISRQVDKKVDNMITSHKKLYGTDVMSSIP